MLRNRRINVVYFTAGWMNEVDESAKALPRYPLITSSIRSQIPTLFRLIVVFITGNWDIYTERQPHQQPNRFVKSETLSVTFTKIDFLPAHIYFGISFLHSPFFIRLICRTHFWLVSGRFSIASKSIIECLSLFFDIHLSIEFSLSIHTCISFSAQTFCQRELEQFWFDLVHALSDISLLSAILWQLL